MERFKKLGGAGAGAVTPTTAPLPISAVSGAESTPTDQNQLTRKRSSDALQEQEGVADTEVFVCDTIFFEC